MNKKFAMSVFAPVVLLAACGGGGDATPTGPQAVSIQFAAVNGSTPIACGSRLPAVGTSAVAADVHDLRFYITKLALITDKGVAVPVTLDANVWQLTKGTENVALIDLEDATGACATATNTKEMNAVITGTVPADTYVGLQASMGVPDALNHSAIAGGAAPLDIAAMAWSWQSGRKFAKIEVDPVGGLFKGPGTSDPHGSAGNTFYVHLGSTGCAARTDANGAAILDAAGNPTYSCGAPNLMDFKFAAFDAAKQQVLLDVGQLLAGNNVSEDNGGAPGCMSGKTDPECPAVFQALQIDLAGATSGQPLNGGAAQTVFRVGTK